MFGLQTNNRFGHLQFDDENEENVAAKKKNSEKRKAKKEREALKAAEKGGYIQLGIGKY